MNFGTPKNITTNRFGQWREQFMAMADPFREQRPVEIQAAARINGALPVKRQMVAELPDQNVREQCGAGDPARNRARGRIRLGNVVASGAGELWPDVTNDLKTRRHVLEHFRDILTQRLKMAAALRATVRRRRMRHRFARQGFGERLAFPRVLLNRTIVCREARLHRLGNCNAQRFIGQAQVELPELFLCFRLLTEMQAPIFGDE